MSTPPRALIVDWGGVLTDRLDVAMRAWAADEGIDFESYAETMRRWILVDGSPRAANPVHAIERGEVPVVEFEATLAAALGELSGNPVRADGLVQRMFAKFRPVTAMNDLVARVRRHGVRTALLSNSMGNSYPRDGWDEMFDAVVISGEVGLRKPEHAIFRLACERLGVETSECVFVDDLSVNVAAGQQLGMVAIQHTSHDETVPQLEELLGLRLTR